MEQKKTTPEKRFIIKKRTLIILTIFISTMLTGLFFACNKVGDKSSNSPTTKSLSGPFSLNPTFFGTNQDSLVLTSKIHTNGSTCSIGDSTRVITIIQNTDGSVRYSYTTRLATQNDKFITYSDDSLVRVNSDLITTTLSSTQTYFIIYFDNPTEPSEIAASSGSTITFTCECCSGQGGCTITGSCCPFDVDCDGTNCNGDCGLNASGSIFGTTGTFHTFILVAASAVHLK